VGIRNSMCLVTQVRIFLRILSDVISGLL